jgi:hypothetical protein
MRNSINLLPGCGEVIQTNAGAVLERKSITFLPVRLDQVAIIVRLAQRHSQQMNQIVDIAGAKLLARRVVEKLVDLLS